MARPRKHPRPPPPSEGARLLTAVAGTLSEIAKAIGAKSATTVMDLRTGRRVPGAELREACARLYAIPVTSWDVPTADAPAPPELPLDQLVPGKLKPTKQECEDQLLRVRAAAEDPNCSPATAARLGLEIRGLLRLRHQLEAQEPWSQDRLASSPVFQRVAEQIAEVVHTCDRCSAALEPVLKLTAAGSV